MSLLSNRDPDYRYATIAYHDSWLTVDPIVGCSSDCRYCFMRMTGWTGVRPEQILTVDEAVDLLTSHPRFQPHETVLSFGNQTDPFLPANWTYLETFLDRLDSLRLSNALVLVTKKAIPGFLVGKLGSFRHLRPILFLSYSGLPSSLERGVRPEDNETNFRNLARAGIPTIHYWRPLTEVNGDAATLTRVLEVVAPTALASVYVGLKLNPGLNAKYAETAGLEVPPELRDSCGEYVPESVERRLRSVAAALHPEYPLYHHASCAVSLALSIPDYNATVYDRAVCGGSNCPRAKRNICERHRGRPTENDVSEALRKVGFDGEFTIGDDSVALRGTVTQQDHVSLTHTLRFPVTAERVICDRNFRGSILRWSHESAPDASAGPER